MMVNNNSNSSKQDDLVRYENPEESYEEREDESSNNKSYIDFNQDSEGEYNFNKSNPKDNPNSKKEEEQNNNLYSAYFSNFNYQSEIEKIELDEIRNQIKKEKSSTSNSKNDAVPISTLKTAISNFSTENKDNFNLNDTIKLNNERKQSALDKFKIKPHEIGSNNVNLIVDNKKLSSVTNINNSRDLKKFINVDVDSNTHNNINQKRSIIDEDKVKPMSGAPTLSLINNSNPNGNVKQSIALTNTKTIVTSNNKKSENNPTFSNKLNSDKQNVTNDQGDEDIDIELEAVSIQITNFNKSFESEEEKEITYSNQNRSERVNTSDSPTIIAPNTINYNVINKTVSPADDIHKTKPKEISRIDKSNTNQNIEKTTKESKEQNKRIIEDNLKLIQELEELKSKLDKKNREALDYKTKYDNLLYDYEIQEKKFTDHKQQLNNIRNELNEKENFLNVHKQDLKKKDDLIQNQSSEILNYQNQTEKIKSEFTSQRSELTKKADKITELQQRIFLLEQENLEIRSKSNKEVMSLRDQKHNFDILKSNYLEIKNQNDLLAIKTQSLTDENTSIKRDLIFYEKEIKTKNEMIENLKNEINSLKSDKINNYTTSYNSQLIKESPKHFSSDNHKLTSNIITHSSNPLNTYESSLNSSQIYTQTENKNSKTSSILNNTVDVIGLSTNPSHSKKNIISHDTNYSSSSINNYVNKSMIQTERPLIGLKKNNSFMNTGATNNILPSQKVIVKNESKILEIEIKLYTLQQERDKIESELAKLPEFPKQKAQILKKKNLELSVSEYAQSINKLRAELRELNVLNRDY